MPSKTLRGASCALVALLVLSSASLPLRASAAPASLSITLDASSPGTPVNAKLASCHLDEGYVHASWSLYSQMIMGAAFDEQSVWNPHTTDPTDRLSYAVDPTVLYYNVSTMRMDLLAGPGPAGITNRGMGNEGLYFVGGKEYEGWALMRSDTSDAVTVYVAMRDYTTNVTLAETSLVLPGNPDGANGSFTNISFTLTPSAGAECVGIAPGSDPRIDCGDTWPSAGHVCVRCGGEILFAISPTSSAPGTHVHIAYTYLQPGTWGRYKGLPVKAEGVATLQQMGITSVRVGGTYAQGIYWKDWRGPMWQRPTRNFYAGNGNLLQFGMFEMLDLGAAMGIEMMITMSRNNSVQDLTDLVDYLYANASYPWGAVRINNDSHPDPYFLTFAELGNEDENDQFTEQIMAMEQRAAEIGLNPSPFYYLYPENTLHAGDIATLKQAGFPAEKVMADCHGGWGGQLASIESDFTAAGDYNISGINCESNGLYNHMGRAIEEALDLTVFDNAPPDVYVRVRARMLSFCNERSGHMTRYDQGGSFWLPNMTWLQPPGYVHAMNSNTRGDFVLAVSPPSPATGEGDGAEADVGLFGVGSEPILPSVVAYSASVSSDGTTVFLRLVNTDNTTSTTVNVTVGGLSVSTAEGSILRAPAGEDVDDAFQSCNTPAQPALVSPAPFSVQPNQPFVLPPLSYLVMTLKGTPTGRGRGRGRAE
jgi:hypothetical protein